MTIHNLAAATALLTGALLIMENELFLNIFGTQKLYQYRNLTKLHVQENESQYDTQILKLTGNTRCTTFPQRYNSLLLWVSFKQDELKFTAVTYCPRDEIGVIPLNFCIAFNTMGS